MAFPTAIRAIISAAILCGLCLGGDAVAQAVHLPVPGPILGMVALLCLLAAFPGLYPWVAPAADLLLRWLGALIVPAAAGIILYGDLFAAHGLALAAVLLVTTLLTGLSIALIYRASVK
jgi:holin-like protein